MTKDKMQQTLATLEGFEVEFTAEHDQIFIALRPDPYPITISQLKEIGWFTDDVAHRYWQIYV